MLVKPPVYGSLLWQLKQTKTQNSVVYDKKFGLYLKKNGWSFKDFEQESDMIYVFEKITLAAVLRINW